MMLYYKYVVVFLLNVKESNTNGKLCKTPPQEHFTNSTLVPGEDLCPGHVKMYMCNVSHLCMPFRRCFLSKATYSAVNGYIFHIYGPTGNRTDNFSFASTMRYQLRHTGVISLRWQDQQMSIQRKTYPGLWLGRLTHSLSPGYPVCIANNVHCTATLPVKGQHTYDRSVKVALDVGYKRAIESRLFLTGLFYQLKCLHSLSFFKQGQCFRIILCHNWLVDMFEVHSDRAAFC